MLNNTQILSAINNSDIVSDVASSIDSKTLRSLGFSKYYSAANWFSVFVLLLAVLQFCKRKTLLSAFQAKKTGLNGIPSPPLIHLIRNVYTVFTSQDIVRTLGTITKGYSTTYRHYYRLKVGTYPVVVLTSPESVEALLSSNDLGHLSKADQYSTIADFFDEGLITSCGEKWKSRRKLFSPLFNYRCFPHFLEVFNRHSKHLLKVLDKLFEDNDEPKPIQTAIYESALKIICETAMEVELNDSSKEFDTFFEEADKSKAYVFKRIARPWLLVEWIWKFHPFRREYERNLKLIKDYMFKVIVDARRKFTEESSNRNRDDTQMKSKNKTVMDIMLENGLSDLDIREEAHTMISAGHETSAAVLQFALMLLAQHHEHQTLCQEEIDEVIKDTSKCPHGDFTLKSIANLKHTERCLKETLRIFPIVHVYGRKIKSPLRLDENIVLPEETTCVVMATDLHMNPEIYPEPEKFDPSRFTPENSANRHPYAYVPFSRGPRMCLGYKFAMTQMTLHLARILHHFSVSTTDKIEDVPFEPSVLMIPARGYNFMLKKRNPLPVHTLD